MALAWPSFLAFVVLTVAFTLKLAIDNDWIGPGARVVTGGVGGVALLYVAERLRGRGLRQYAFILSGGGILILYLSTYAAFDFYKLISQPIAFLLMAVVTTTAVALAVRQDALCRCWLFYWPLPYAALLKTRVNFQICRSTSTNK